MKTTHDAVASVYPVKVKPLTLGDLIASTYEGREKKRASQILQLAMEGNIIKFSQPQHASW